MRKKSKKVLNIVGIENIVVTLLQSVSDIGVYEISLSVAFRDDVFYAGLNVHSKIRKFVAYSYYYLTLNKIIVF